MFLIGFRKKKICSSAGKRKEPRKTTLSFKNFYALYGRSKPRKNPFEIGFCGDQADYYYESVYFKAGQGFDEAFLRKFFISQFLHKVEGESSQKELYDLLTQIPKADPPQKTFRSILLRRTRKPNRVRRSQSFFEPCRRRP